MPVNSEEPVPAAPVIPIARQERRINPPDRYLYIAEINSDVWFSLLFNGMELVFEGDSGFSKAILLNDWMIPGDNTLSIEISPLGKNKTGSYSFILKKQKVEGSDESILNIFTGPGSGSNVSWTFTERNLPFTLIEKADRLSSVPSSSDQKEIAEIVDRLRSAFIAKDINTVTELLRDKNEDIAAVRFLPASEYGKKSAVFYSELMKKPGFAVKPPSRRIYTFSLAQDRRLVSVMQGREGFPEAAIILNYRENGKLVSYEQKLYFAKIADRWIIIRTAEEMDQMVR